MSLVGLHRVPDVRERQELVRKWMERAGAAAGGETIFDFGPTDPAVFAAACESLIGAVTLPVGLVGPLTVHARVYEEDAAGELADRGSERLEVPIPMATHEGGLNASLGRGVKAANACGGVETYLLKASMTRGTCYEFESAGDAYRFSRWIRAQVPAMRAWLDDPANPLRAVLEKGAAVLSRYARLKAVHTHLICNTCHSIFEFTTGDACGQNMSTRNTYLLHQHFVLPRLAAELGIEPTGFLLEANTGGDKKPSQLHHIEGGHGRMVVASCLISNEVLEGQLECTPADVERIRRIGVEGSVLSGMIGFSINPANVIAAIFAATGQDLACVGTSSMAMMTATERGDGLLCALRLPSLEIGTVGGGTGLPQQRGWLELMGCTGPQSANRFAQVVAAAALCLELSTGAAMAAAASQGFYQAHLERGGARRRP